MQIGVYHGLKKEEKSPKYRFFERFSYKRLVYLKKIHIFAINMFN